MNSNNTTPATTVRVSIRASYARLALTCAAEGDDGRYYLSGVLVEPRPEGGAYIIGTDGHTLMLIEQPDAICTEPTLLNISADLADDLPALFPNGADRTRLLMLEPPQQRALLQLVNAQGDVVRTQDDNACMPARRDTGRPWYDWRKVMPDFSALKPGLVDPFQGGYAARVLDAFAGSPQMEPAQAGTEKVIAFQFQHHPEALLLVMPQYRGAWIEQERPGWLARWSAVKAAQQPAAEAA